MAKTGALAGNEEIGYSHVGTGSVIWVTRSLDPKTYCRREKSPVYVHVAVKVVKLKGGVECYLQQEGEETE